MRTIGSLVLTGFAGWIAWRFCWSQDENRAVAGAMSERRGKRESLEERDPAAAIEALEEGIDDRYGFIRRHRAELERHIKDVEIMRESLGMLKARHPEIK